jgi:6-phosphogluconate dehydrogenase
MMPEATADIALIGLAVMGQNLVLNMDDHGFTVAVHNRTPRRTQEFLAGPAAGTRVIGADSLPELVSQLKRPRRVMIMVKAGAPVDAVIQELIPLLEPGDIIIDGGNSHHADSARREEELARAGLLFIGAGVSGGEEGARHGPSIMPGGNEAAWPAVRPIFEAISAKVDGLPCCTWLGPGGSGHYVKMVHNGIEYGDMQLIAEAYQLMSEGAGMPAAEMSEVFGAWNEGRLDSYLIGITRDILAFRDEDGGPLVERILDTAGQKGTGKWTAVDALDAGIPLTLIAGSVFARFLSALKDERVAASGVLVPAAAQPALNRDEFLVSLEQALYGAKIVSYAQGYMLLQQASLEHGWNLDFAAIALLWRGGCIIRSRFLNDIARAYREEPDLQNLLLDPFFRDQLAAVQSGWREVVAQGVLRGIPVPTLAAGIIFYDGYRHERLPANLIQAQRDYFGAHTYERIDRPRGEFFHTDWTGHGGKVSSTSYEA